MNTNTETKAGTCAKCGCVNLDSDEMHGDFCLDCAKAGELTGSRWYQRPTAGHETHGQSVVIDEETGRDIAIVYDGDAHARLLAASPRLFDALTGAAMRLEFALEHVEDHEQRLNIEAEIRIARAAIALVEGGAS